MKELEKLLKQHEGYRTKPYKCSAGKISIGIGFNLDDVGLYPEEIDFILRNRIKRKTKLARAIFPWFNDLSKTRQVVILDMLYNIGPGSLLGFRKMITAIEEGDFARAADEMLKSKWSEQVGNRAKRLARFMRENKIT